MIDHEFGREKRVDALGIAAKFLHGLAHGGQVDDCGHAREVLQQHAGRHEGGFSLRAIGGPFRKSANVVGMDKAAVFTAHQVFEKDAEREGKISDGTEPLLFEFFEAIDFEDLRANAKFVSGIEGVCCGDGHSQLPFTG